MYAAVLGSRVADREINAADTVNNTADMETNAADTTNNRADTTNAPQPGTKMCRACGASAVSYVRVSRLRIS